MVCNTCYLSSAPLVKLNACSHTPFCEKCKEVWSQTCFQKGDNEHATCPECRAVYAINPASEQYQKLEEIRKGLEKVISLLKEGSKNDPSLD